MSETPREQTTETTAAPPTPPRSDFSSEVKKLGASSLVLVIPTLLTRGASVLLIPLYTSVLTPADYGITAIATAMQMFLATTLGVATHTSTYRLHYTWETEEDRRKLYGSLLSFLLVVPAVVVGGLHLAGAAGAFDGVSPLPFEPLLVLVLWTAYFSVFQSFPPNLFLVREKAKYAAYFNLAAFAFTTVAMIVFVVVLRQGALGQLRATFASSAAIAVVSVGILARYARPTLSWRHLRAALVFGAPLVPHLLANWGLAVSDRLVLEHFRVPENEIGLYSFAYTISSVVAVFTGAVARGLQPILTRKLSQKDNVDDVPRLATVALLATLVVALPGAMFAREAVELLTPSTYSGAVAYVPWLVLAVVFQTLYYSLTQGIYQSSRTAAVPLVTGAALGLNLVLNVLLVPRYGAYAAAVSTAVAFLALATFHGALAHRLHPIPWPYWKWVRLLVGAVALFLLGEATASLGLVARVAIKAALVVLGLPASLVVFGVFTPAELATRTREGWRAVGARLRPKTRG